jgi:hypothetical protein
MLSEVIKSYCNVSQVYHRFEIYNSNSNDKHKIVFEVTDYEKTLCDDKMIIMKYLMVTL